MMEFENTHYIVGTNNEDIIAFFADGSTENSTINNPQYGVGQLPSNADSIGLYAYGGDDQITAESTGNRLDLIDAGFGDDSIWVNNNGKGVQVITGGRGYDLVNLMGRKKAWGDVTFSREYDWAITLKSQKMGDLIIAYDVDMIFLGDVAYWSTENLERGNETPLTRDEITNIERNPDWVYSTDIFREFDLEEAAQDVVKDYFGSSGGGGNNVGGGNDDDSSNGENIRRGTNGDDLFEASNKKESVYGYEGDDIAYIKPNGNCRIQDVDGDKYIDMGKGNDEVMFNSPDDREIFISLGKGEDKLFLSGGGRKNKKVEIEGGGGNDVLEVVGTGWSPTIRGNGGKDFIYLRNYSDVNATIYGGKGKDNFYIYHGASHHRPTVTIKDFSVKKSEKIYMYAMEPNKFTYKQKGNDLHIKITSKKDSHDYKLTYILEDVNKKEFKNSGSGIENTPHNGDFQFNCTLQSGV